MEALGEEIGRPIQTPEPIFAWLMRHSGWLLTRYRVRPDGRTSYQLLQLPSVEILVGKFIQDLPRCPGDRSFPNLQVTICPTDQDALGHERKLHEV